MNRLKVGMTQSGKTTDELRKLVERIGATVICDPHDQLTRMYAEYLACHPHSFPVRYDQLNRTDRVLRWNFIEPSKSTDPVRRSKENDDEARDFAEILCRRRGLDIHKTPVIEKWAIAAITLWQYQKHPKPLSRLMSAFDRGEGLEELVNDCDHQIVNVMAPTRYYPDARFAQSLEHAQRLFEATINSPAFAMRCGGGFDFRSILDQGGKILIGGDRANRNATRVIMSSVIHLVIKYIRSGGKPVLLVVDEANNYDLIGRPELESLAEDSKLGLSWDILVQSLDFESKTITDSVLQNTQRHEWFRCSGETAKQAGYDLGVASLDPKKVHHVDTKKKQLHKGYSKEKTKNTSWRTGKSTDDPNNVKRAEDTHGRGDTGVGGGESEHFLADFDTIEEETIHYEKLTDQVMLMEQKVMTQPVGHRMVFDKARGKVFGEQVKPVEAHVWIQVAKVKAARYIEKLIGEHGMPPCLDYLKYTPSRSASLLRPSSGNGKTKRNRDPSIKRFGGGLAD